MLSAQLKHRLTSLGTKNQACIVSVFPINALPRQARAEHNTIRKLNSSGVFVSAYRFRAGRDAAKSVSHSEFDALVLGVEEEGRDRLEACLHFTQMQ